MKIVVGIDLDAATRSALFEVGSIVKHEKVAAMGFLKTWEDLLKEELVKSDIIEVPGMSFNSTM